MHYIVKNYSLKNDQTPFKFKLGFFFYIFILMDIPLYRALSERMHINCAKGTEEKCVFSMCNEDLLATNLLILQTCLILQSSVQ